MGKCLRMKEGNNWRPWVKTVTWLHKLPLQEQVAILIGIFSNNFSSMQEEITIQSNPLRAKATPLRRRDTGLAERMEQEEDNEYDDALSIVPSLEGNKPKPLRWRLKWRCILLMALSMPKQLMPGSINCRLTSVSMGIILNIMSPSLGPSDAGGFSTSNIDSISFGLAAGILIALEYLENIDKCKVDK